MNRRLQLLAALVILLLGAITLWAWVQLRLRDSRLYAQPHTVQRGGTNYVVQLQETTLGQSGTNCLLILHLRLHNPNPFPVRLQRQAFGLVDHDKDYYAPATDGPQADWIELPPNGTREREALRYSVPADTFLGTLALYAGHYYYVLVKDKQPYEPNLGDGQFVSFRRREW